MPRAVTIDPRTPIGPHHKVGIPCHFHFRGSASFVRVFIAMRSAAGVQGWTGANTYKRRTQIACAGASGVARPKYQSIPACAGRGARPSDRRLRPRLRRSDREAGGGPAIFVAPRASSHRHRWRETSPMPCATVGRAHSSASHVDGAGLRAQRVTQNRRTHARLRASAGLMSGRNTVSRPMAGRKAQAR